MRFKRLEVTIYTEKMKQSRDFYEKHFGFVMDSGNGWTVRMVSPEQNVGINFMMAGREDGGFFTASGIAFSFDVDDVRAEYERLISEGVHIGVGLDDKPWGGQSFVVTDPNGIYILVSQSMK